MQTKKIDPRDMPPRNFVFLVDSSGSMQPENRLPLLKKSLGMLVDQLGERDRVAIVTYAGEARLVLDATSGDRREAIRSAINSLHSGGSTNGGGGIVMAYDIAAKNLIAGGLNRVILGTDGDFNVGVSDDGSLVRMIEERRKSGVFLTILGYGMGNLRDWAREARPSRQRALRHARLRTSPAAVRRAARASSPSPRTPQVPDRVQSIEDRRLPARRLREPAGWLIRDFNDDAKDAGDPAAGTASPCCTSWCPPAPTQVPGIDPLKYQKLELTKAAESDEWLTLKLRYKDPKRRRASC